jgi:hypothetical protein
MSGHSKWSKVKQFKGAIDAKRKNQHLIDIVVFLIVALGVLNTMTIRPRQPGKTEQAHTSLSDGKERGDLLDLVLVAVGSKLVQ